MPPPPQNGMSGSAPGSNLEIAFRDIWQYGYCCRRLLLFSGVGVWVFFTLFGFLVCFFVEFFLMFIMFFFFRGFKSSNISTTV